MSLPLNQVLCGDWIDVMHGFPDESIDMALFSPPYWGLRDYGVESQLGLESHPQEYIQHIIDGCREIKRILKKSGNMWINLGDTYFGGGRGQKFENSPKQASNKGSFSYASIPPAKSDGSNWLQPKQKLLIPHRVAIALQDDGWILRNDAVWHKSNAMPSSVKDRLSNSFEFVFHFVKQRRYYYDLDAIRVPSRWAIVWSRKGSRKEPWNKNNPRARWGLTRKEYRGKFDGFGLEAEKYGSPRARTQRAKTLDESFKGSQTMRQAPEPNEPHAFHELGKNPGDVIRLEPKMIQLLEMEGVKSGGHTAKETHHDYPLGKNPADVIKIGMHHGSSLTTGRATHYEGQIIEPHPLGANPSDFLEINTQPSNDYWCPQCKNFVKMENLKCLICGTKVESHFAVYPESLCELPIKATCPQWVCKKCGKPREKILRKTGRIQQVWAPRRAAERSELAQGPHGDTSVITTGHKWAYEVTGLSICNCDAGFESGIILDPMCGSGTTLITAQKLGRRWIGIDLNPIYVEMAKKRLRQNHNQKLEQFLTQT